MPHFGEFLRGRRPDFPAQRLGVRQRGKRRLQFLVAPAQGVVVRVGDHRRVLAVITPVVLGDFGAEPSVFRPGRGERGFLLRGLAGGHGG